MAWRTKIKEKMATKRMWLRILLAEFLGTFLLMIFGQGAVAQSVLSKGAMGDFWAITVGYGLAVMMGVASCIGVSGGHINPAVTLPLAILGRTRWTHVPFYVLGQYFGSFFASVLTFLVYYDGMYAYDPLRTVYGPGSTAQIFTTFPNQDVSTLNTFGDQVVATALLMLGVLVLVDSKNMQPTKNLIPFFVGLLVMLIGNSFAFNCGYAINPARDLSPRIFAAMAGWGGDVFSFRDYWFWVPTVGPYVGGILGAMFYQIMVGIHLPPASTSAKRENV